MVWSLSHGHILALAAMAVNIVLPELAGCQHGALRLTTGSIMGLLVNVIKRPVSVMVLTIKSRRRR